MSPIAPRSVGLVVALTASVAAAAGLVAGALLRPFTPRRPARSGEYGIRNVPSRPPLWDARPGAGAVLTVPGLHEASAVPPEDRHHVPA
jgi:hypothetical protein